MTLADDLAGITPEGPGRTCKVGFLIGADTPLDDEDRAALEDAVANMGVRASDLSRLLDRWGHRCPQDTISRHRRGDCKCPKAGD